MIRAIVGVSATLLVAAACADPRAPGGTRQTESGRAAEAHRPAPPSIKKVSRAENGGRVALLLGDELVVELEANGAAPYEWRVIERPAALRLADARLSAPPESNPAIAGAPGVQQYRFRAERLGRGRLRLGYFDLASGAVRPSERWFLTVEVVASSRP